MVVKRTEGVTVTGSSVWHCQSFAFSRRYQSTDPTTTAASPTPSSAGITVIDDLPSFATLITDEERERKAEASSPGTYNVVVIPDSFQHLPEYSDGVEVERENTALSRRTAVAASLAGSLGRDSSLGKMLVSVPGDPNTIILCRFEDLSPASTHDIEAPVLPAVQDTFIKVEGQETKPVRTEEELKCLEHFRTVVWRQLTPIESERATSAVIVEKIAAKFPPLLHAMLATASQSLARRKEQDPCAALQYYTRAVGYLKNQEDFASDGVFLTHFLMLVYEIATADTEHSSIRTRHLSMLLSIALLRRNASTSETFPYVIWRICNIDLEALFSGAGSGEFVRNMLENQSAALLIYRSSSLDSDGAGLVFNEENETLNTIWTIGYRVTALAVHLATLAEEFRSDENFRYISPRERAVVIQLRESRVYEFQNALRQLRPALRVHRTGETSLPPRFERLRQHALSLYMACVIFSHTSMWPAQRVDTRADCHEEIAYAATEIIQLAQGMLCHEHIECRFLVFPIFLAGYAGSNRSQKLLALDLVKRMERESIGRNTAATRQVLERVYEEQQSRVVSNGHCLDVDWMTTMVRNNLSVIDFGT